MKSGTGLLFLFLVAGLGVGTAALMHPRGIGGLSDDLMGRRVPDPAAGKFPEPGPPDVASADGGVPAESAAQKAYADGRRDGLEYYDQGQFSLAYTSFLSARSVTPRGAARDELSVLTHRALLAHFLVDGASAYIPDDPVAEYEKRLAAAEAAPGEKAWMDLTRYAVAVGLDERAPYAAEKALTAARPGGPVQQQLVACLDFAEGRRAMLIESLMAYGLDTSAARTVTGTGGTSGGGISGHEEPDDMDEPSGIGGASRRGVPFGNFDAAMRARLKSAVAWQADGENEYDLAGPDQGNARKRRLHRHKALEKLKAAREVYSDALDADPDARDVEARLHQVTQLIAFLNKDGGFGD